MQTNHWVKVATAPFLFYQLILRCISTIISSLQSSLLLISLLDGQVRAPRKDLLRLSSSFDVLSFEMKAESFLGAMDIFFFVSQQQHTILHFCKLQGNTSLLKHMVSHFILLHLIKKFVLQGQPYIVIIIVGEIITSTHLIVI